MKRTMAAAGIVVALACGLSANAAPTQELRDHVEVMLNAPEYAPSEQEWTALGPDAEIVLRDIALNDKVLLIKRGRAITALGYFKTAASRDVLSELVASSKASWILRGKAAHALALAHGDASLSTIEPLLTHKNKRIREVAIKAISVVTSAQSQKVLLARLPNEKNKHLRRTIDTAARKIATRLKARGSK